tara:strand:- start:245 stop:502 length:258 start_codon:yes stop_codon:yes gene_type:complete
MSADTLKISRAEEAQRIYKAEIFNDSWEELKNILTEKLLNTDPLDKETRELHYHRIKLLDELKEALIRIMNEGSLEASQLKLRRK